MKTPKIKKEYKDSRGIIYTFFVDGKEELLIFTREGFKRGGHMHKDIQHTMVLSGNIEWREWINDHEVITVLNEGDKQATPSFVPHLLTALNDCWILETKVDNDNSLAKVFAKCYRDQIEKDIEEE